MKEEQIRLLLKEFDYDKNTMDDTLDFLLYMVNEIKNRKKEIKKPICCLCGRECENEWGNSPWPLSKNDNDRCCDLCNFTQVLPVRMLNAKNGEVS